MRDRLEVWIVWAPAGVHSIRPINGAARPAVIDEEAARLLRASFDAARIRGRRLWIDFHHDEREAAGDALDFAWDPERGIMLAVRLTRRAERMIRAGELWSFSPSYHPDECARPATLLDSGCVGGLLNRPAFQKMPQIVLPSRR